MVCVVLAGREIDVTSNFTVQPSEGSFLDDLDVASPESTCVDLRYYAEVLITWLQVRSVVERLVCCRVATTC